MLKVRARADDEQNTFWNYVKRPFSTCSYLKILCYLTASCSLPSSRYVLIVPRFPKLFMAFVRLMVFSSTLLASAASSHECGRNTSPIS